MPLSENISSADFSSSEAVTQADSNSDSNSQSGKIGKNETTSQTHIGAEKFQSIENESNENLPITTVSMETGTEVYEPTGSLPVLIGTEETGVADSHKPENTSPETGLLEKDEQQNESVETGESILGSDDNNQSLEDENSQTDSAEYSQQFFQQSDDSQDFLTGTEHAVDNWSFFHWLACKI